MGHAVVAGRELDRQARREEPLVIDAEQIGVGGGEVWRRISMVKRGEAW